MSSDSLINTSTDKSHFSNSELDEILKKSKTEALSEERYLNEVDRINKFISNIKKNNFNKEDFIEKAKDQKYVHIDTYFGGLKILEYNLCSYYASFSGIPSKMLPLVRVVESNVNVADDKGNVHILKGGDILIRYSSGKGAYGYLHKSGLHSDRYKEKYISLYDNQNYFLFGQSQQQVTTNWIIISDNFLSGLAIYSATDISTISISNPFDLSVLKEIMGCYPDKKILYFVDGVGKKNDEELGGITYVYSPERIESCWAESRDTLQKNLDHNKTKETFKELLREAIRNA